MLNEIKRVKQFQTSPKTELKGHILLGWLNNQLAEYTQPRLAAHGVEEVDPDAWYPAQMFLDIMREVVESNENVTTVLVAVGKSVAENMPVGDFSSMDDFKNFIEGMHRGPSARYAPAHENIFLIEEDGQHFVLNNTPMSNDILYGFIWELLRRNPIGGVNYYPVPEKDYPSVEYGSTFLLRAR